MPSNSILVQKQQLVADLAEQIKNSTAGVIVNYQGITVDKDTAMRKELREAGVKYVVMKNTMTGRACEMVGYGDMKQYLTGMTAIAIGNENDPVAPAKVLKEYAEKIESFQILAGYLDGAVVDADTVNKLADIPSKEVLVAKFLGSIQNRLRQLRYLCIIVLLQGCCRSNDSLHYLTARQISANASGLLFHILQQCLCAAQIVVNTLAADIQLLSDLTKGKVLIIAHIEAKPLTLC